MEDRNSAGQLKTGYDYVQIQLITGYNTDRHDLVAGGSAILGPYMRVVKSHADDFLAEMKRRYGNDRRIRDIKITDSGFLRMDKVPTLSQEIEDFEIYLSDPRNW